MPFVEIYAWKKGVNHISSPAHHIFFSSIIFSLTEKLNSYTTAWLH